MNITETRIRPETLDLRGAGLPVDTGNEGRVLVVVTAVSKEAELASRIRLLAEGGDIPVLLFGACRSEDQLPGLRRDLTTTAAFLRNQGVAVTLTATHGSGWLRELRSALRAGDRVACYAEGGRGPGRQPLIDVLAEALGHTVYDLSGIDEVAGPGLSRLKQAALWAGNLLILAGFGVLQARIAGGVQGSMQTALLVFLLFPEVAVLLGWNALFP